MPLLRSKTGVFVIHYAYFACILFGYVCLLPDSSVIVAVFLNRGPGFPPFVGYFLFVEDDSSFELRYDGTS